ncbi:hypothetical protein F5X99DRAFT_366534 [Biscogniauxia marginata]|nr:hypothetical protein F5X99DRAFT_366534 [Biscogniauxia marginata]
MVLSLGATQVVVVGFITTPLAFMALGLRLWSRRIQRSSLAFNDYMSIVAMIFAIGTVSLCIADAFAGAIGVHASEIMATRPWVLAFYLRLSVPGQLLWASANTSVKLSILSLYTVIFPNQRFHYICYSAMGISIAYLASVFAEAFALCTPVEYNWDKSIPGGECHNENLAYLIAGITNLVIDAFIVALPMPMLFGLQMSLTKKLSIAGMFSLGALICVLSLLRVVSLLEWDLTDITYTGTRIAIYSILEPTLGVVNACLPTIKPALHKISRTHPFDGISKGSNSTNKSSLNASRDRKRPPGAGIVNHHEFIRLNDDVPLTNIRTGNEMSADLDEINAITVTRGWEVDRSCQ